MKANIGQTIKKTLWRLLTRLGEFAPRDVESRLSRAEEKLFEQYQTPAHEIQIVFILASPRTGSTLLYQLMAKHLGLHYFSNYVAQNFPAYPLIGTIVESAIIENLADGISLHSRFGETAGPHEPNEATTVLANWFSFEHPAETRSANVLRGRRSHLTSTIAGISAFTGKQIVIKNAWNCFRVKELISVFPASRFVWLRRDIADSSYSALQARKTQGDPTVIWNSASPANYSEIRRLPSVEQVVEQQYWTNTAVENSLRQYVAAENWEKVWYEDLISDPDGALAAVAKCIAGPRARSVAQDLTTIKVDLRRSHRASDSDEFDQILRYAESKYPDFVRQ